MIESLPPTGLGGDGIHLDIHFVEPTNLAAAELRRLHEVNAELLKALKSIALTSSLPTDHHVAAARWALIEIAQAAIAKTEGESK
jgi:hypothetical protein